MKSTFIWLGALIVAGAATATVRADGCASCADAYRPHWLRWCKPCNKCVPGSNAFGFSSCPANNGPMPAQPFNGMMMMPPTGGGIGFPTHPYARSPRDFFMVE